LLNINYHHLRIIGNYVSKSLTRIKNLVDSRKKNVRAVEPDKGRHNEIKKIKDI
jgi:hypothetical protein